MKYRDMKILHTSDWHLGHRFYEHYQYEEQTKFLNWLEAYIQDHQVDILLVAGDIFDSGVPATQSQKLYYDFLVNLKKNCRIIITAGNHDAPGTINAPQELLKALSIQVVGKVSEHKIEDQVFEFCVGSQKVIIAAVPYLRDQDIRRAVAGESFEQIGDRYKTALINHYNEVAAYCQSIRKDKTPMIAMGHLFVISGSTSDSVKSIYVGSLGDIGADDFPDIFDFVALGHLHRPQKAGKLDHIRYCGSPYQLSFSEAHQKKVIVIEIENDKLTDIKEVDIPIFREIRRIKGNLEECIAQLESIDQKYHELTPWIEVVLDQKSNLEFGEINKAVQKFNLEVLRVNLKHTKKNIGLENIKPIKELSPLEVFKIKCRDQDYDLSARPEILDAFNEVLQIANQS